MKIPRTAEKPQDAPIFFGLDVMMRNAGIVGIDVNGDKVIAETWDCPYKGIARVNFYYETFLDLISKFPSAYYGIEDYAYGKGGSNSRSTFSIGEITGTYKLHLYRSRLPLYIFGIGQIKKFFVGKGNCGKDMVVDQALTMVSFIPTPQNKTQLNKVSHLADAYAISLMTRYYTCGGTSNLDSKQIRWLGEHNARDFEIR